jgi:hypothetical protein
MPDSRLNVWQALSLAEANLEKLKDRHKHISLQLEDVDLEIQGLRMAIAREGARIDGGEHGD